MQQLLDLMSLNRAADVGGARDEHHPRRVDALDHAIEQTVLEGSLAADHDQRDGQSLELAGHELGRRRLTLQAVAAAVDAECKPSGRPMRSMRLARSAAALC